MNTISRRTFQQQTLGSLLTWSLLDTLFSGDAFAEEVKPIAAKWLAELNSMSLDLKGQKLDPLQWQKQVEQLFAKVDLPELLRFIDFDKLTEGTKLMERGETSLKAKLPQVEGLPTNLVFGHQVFALNKDRSVVPHGHDNMATAFLVMKGDFRGRHYDRLEDDPKHMIVKPTIDKTFGPGTFSTLSDVKDNVHWFQAKCDGAFIFNIHVMNVVPGRTGRIYIDPDGEKLSGGRIRARKIDHAEANRLYG
ncbi:MAG: hypothetical protein H7062_09360 [Candidatus Saccharimonas sp.]|nr:hypothetical protein [Planctomycetaceae bacterium]